MKQWSKKKPPGLNGLDAARQLKKRFPGIKVIILTVYENEEYVLQMVVEGLKNREIAKLLFVSMEIRVNNDIYFLKFHLS
ncbi:MAG: DNA-binding response regulator [Desulfobacteraceae bacterium]|nr:MAG: DNA-binding response regulator [Desulfobacteraceae bacterium]